MVEQSILIVGLGNYSIPLTRHRYVPPTSLVSEQPLIRSRVHSVGQLALESLATRLGVTLAYDRNTMSWTGQKDVDIVPPQPRAKKGKGKAQEGVLDTAELAVPAIRTRVTLVKPSMCLILPVHERQELIP